MKREILQRQAEKKTLSEDLQSTSHQIATDKKEYEKLMEELEMLKVINLSYNSSFPFSIRLYILKAIIGNLYDVKILLFVYIHFLFRVENDF